MTSSSSWLAPLSPAKVSDDPVFLPRNSLYFRKGKESFVYSDELDLLSFDPYDLNRAIPWTDNEVSQLQDLTNLTQEAPDGQIDWKSVSEQLKSKSAFQCFSFHHNSLQTSSEPWTGEEEKKLLRLVKLYKEHYWSQVAEELGTGRSPMDCLRHYQQALNPNLSKVGEWTKEEDQLLNDLVKQYGDDKWQTIASHLPGRTSVQCSDRFRHRPWSQDHIIAGPWTNQDNRALLLAAIACEIPCNAGNENSTEEREETSVSGDQVSRNEWNGKWTTLAKLVPGKNDVQVREKWCNQVDPSLCFAEYSEDEIVRLKELVDRLGEGKWAQIAQHLPGRTDKSVRRKWLAIKVQEGEVSGDINNNNRNRRGPKKCKRPLPSQYNQRRTRAKISEQDFIATNAVDWTQSHE
eukprot:gene6001-6610_t